MANIGGGLPLRVCDLCGAVDDHSRHVIAGVVPGEFRPSDGALERVLAEAPEAQCTELVRALLDTTSSDRHRDCCRDAGCPNGTCPIVLEGADGLTGAALHDYLTEHADDIRGRLTAHAALLGGN